MHCGNRFPEDECVLLRQIRDSVEESQREILNIRNLIRRSQKKPTLGKNLLYAIIGIILIVTVVAILFLDYELCQNQLNRLSFRRNEIKRTGKTRGDSPCLTPSAKSDENVLPFQDESHKGSRNGLGEITVGCQLF